MSHDTEYEFSHNSSTEIGSSGSPIFLKGTTKVIGIHKGFGGLDNALENYGDFLWPIFTYFKNFNEDEENIEYDIFDEIEEQKIMDDKEKC